MMIYNSLHIQRATLQQHPLETAVWTFISLCAVRKQSTMVGMVSVGVACVVSVAIVFVSQYSFAQDFY